MAYAFDADYGVQMENLCVNRVFRDRTYSTPTTDAIFFRFRMRKHEILTLHEELSSKLKSPQSRKGALSVLLHLKIAIRFYASGSFLDVVGDM